MMLLLLLCVVYNVGLIHANWQTTDVFDFFVCPESKGKANGRVMFNVVGNIGKNEKTVKIPITVPYCHELVFVRVKVDNPTAPPAVYLDEEYLVVTIKYRLKQDSASSYVVIAKTIPNKDCNKGGGGCNSADIYEVKGGQEGQEGNENTAVEPAAGAGQATEGEATEKGPPTEVRR